MIRSFISSISIAPLPVRYYSEALPTQHGYCARVSRRRLRVKDLPKVHTWRPERDSKQGTSRRKASTQPKRHHVPHMGMFTYGLMTLILFIDVDFHWNQGRGLPAQLGNE